MAHAHIRPQIIGYRRDGRPIHLIAGGSEPPPEGQQGQQDDGGDLGDLLGEPEGQQGDPPDDQPPAWWGAASAALTAQTNAEIDRRINQLGTRRRGQGQGQQGQQGQQEPQAPQGPTSADVREARSVFREVLSEAGLQLSPVERELANSAGRGAIQFELDQHGDPDQAGTRAAGFLADQIKKLRKSHQDALLRKLEGLGALDRTKLKPGTPQGQQGQQGTATAAQQWSAGQDKARQLAEKRGLTLPGTSTTSGT